MAIKEGRIAAYIHTADCHVRHSLHAGIDLQVPIRLVSAPEKNMDALLTVPLFRKEILTAKVSVT